MVKKGSLTFGEEEWSGVSDEAFDLISCMIETDMEKRLSAEEALAHPFFDPIVRCSSCVSHNNLTQKN